MGTLNRNVHVLGKNNFVDPGARNISIVGDNNKVQGAISNVTIVGDNKTVTESGTIWQDGVLRSDNANGRGEDVVRKSADFNVEIHVKQYLIDTSAGDVDVDMESIFVTGEIYPDYKVFIKKTVQANKITFSSGTNITIDGFADGTKDINNKNTNLQLWYEGYGRMFVV